MTSPVGNVTPIERPQTHRHKLEIETRARVEFKDITDQIQQWVGASGITDGVCYVFVPHTTAAVLINENDDPSLMQDLGNFLGQLAPRDKAYHHADVNCDAHLKASLIGCSKVLMIEHGRLVLGRWQGVYFCEFDGPRRRELRVRILAD